MAKVRCNCNLKLCDQQPSDRLKSEEEIAIEEKEKLEHLEAERIQRMHGLPEGNKYATKHRSADDLDDGYDHFYHKIFLWKTHSIL